MLSLFTSSAAQEAVPGEVRIEQQKGFGRVVLSFPVPLVARASVAGGVAVVRFDRPVALQAEKLGPQLPAYISAARLDPDRRALRIALAQSLTVDLKDGAEQVFLDLLPANWRGAPPPIPADVAAKLAQRARAAQAAIPVGQPVSAVAPHLVTVALARTNGLIRLTFPLAPGITGRTEVANGRVTVAFEGAARLDEQAIRAALASALEGLRFETGGARLSFTLPAGMRAKGMMDDGAFAVDLAETGPEKPARSVDAAPAEGSILAKGAVTAVPPAVAPPPAAQPPAAPPPTTASSAMHAPASGSTRREERPRIFDADAWAQDRRGSVREAWYGLISQAAEAPRRERSGERLRLASFELANGLAVEAGAVIAAMAEDDPRAVATRPALLMRGLALLMAQRGAEAAVYLNDPMVAEDGEAALLRAWVAAQTGQPQAAHAGFVANADVLQGAPEILQGMMLPAVIDTALEAKDLAFAGEALAMLERLDASERDPAMTPLYRGRIAAEQGKLDGALALFEKARGGSRPVEAQARLHGALLAHSAGSLPVEAARAELETVGMIWRRGPVEAQARVRLAEIAIGEGRWREAFAASRRAVEIQPELPAVRALQDEMGKRFEALFLGPQAAGLPKIEALAIFEEFRALIPPGPRGDEIVRQLAERLVDLDLTAQAAELLTYQMEHRLKGHARAEAGARLALLYLEDGLAKQALGALHASRYAVLPPELRRVRVELEARALSELGRTELALEMLASATDAETGRARGDIYWRAKRWDEAAEAYESAMAPVAEPDAAGRVHILRAAIGYLLAGDQLGTHRLREIFAPRMAASPDGELFEAILAGSRPEAGALGAVAKAAGPAGTMAAFLDAYRKRFAERPQAPPDAAPGG